VHTGKRRGLIVLASLLILTCPSSTYSQQDTIVWVPFTAERVARTYTLSASGRGDIISETRKFTGRNKDGSLVEYDSEQRVGILQDAAT
jgi:hypothetical protein